MNDAFCGGPDGKSLNASAPLVSEDAFKNVAALILMGDPRHVPGSPFNVGNATVGGVSISPGGARTLDQRTRCADGGGTGVCGPTEGFSMPGLRRSNSAILRLTRPVLLQRNGSSGASRIWKRVRCGCAKIHLEQAVGLIYRNCGVRSAALGSLSIQRGLVVTNRTIMVRR